MTTMKRTTILLFTIVLSLGSVFAQNKNRTYNEIPEDMKDKVKAHKVAFLTEHLDLTSKEAEKFWPIYNEFENKKETERQTVFELINKKPEEFENMTDSEAEKILNGLRAHEERMSSLEKEYENKILKVLPAKKVLKLHNTERKFKRELLRDLKERRRDNRRNTGDMGNPEMRNNKPMKESNDEF